MFFEIFKGKNNQFYFNLKTEEKVVMKSEGYKSKAGRDNGINSVKENSQNLEKFESDHNSFVLKARNGEIIASSTIFESKEEVEAALKMVHKKALKSEIKERK